MSCSGRTWLNSTAPAGAQLPSSPHRASSQHHTAHGNHYVREEPGTHLIFRLASIVLSILGREQRKVLLQAQGLQM